jgi:hypothetical protein
MKDFVNVAQGGKARTVELKMTVKNVLMEDVLMENADVLKGFQETLVMKKSARITVLLLTFTLKSGEKK